MKVILLRDVAKLGKRFSVVAVADGYALNRLIPQGFAEAATGENLKRVQARTDKQSSDRSSEVADFIQALAHLKESGVVVVVEANAQDTLFKAVKASDVAAAAATAGHGIPVDSIQLPDHIKALGTYTVKVVFGDAHGEFPLTVTGK